MRILLYTRASFVNNTPCFNTILALNYAQQLVQQGHWVDITLTGDSQRLPHPIKKVWPHAPWERYDIIIAEAPALDRAKHYALEKIKLRDNQKLFFKLVDLEWGWKEPDEAQLLELGLDSGQAKAFASRKPNGIVSDSPDFEEMWQAFGSKEEFSPTQIPWFWDAQTLWLWLTSEPELPLVPKKWSVGYFGFNKPDRAKMLNKLLADRPKDITFAIAGPISFNTDIAADFVDKRTLSPVDCHNLMAELWTMPYLINSAMPQKLNFRLYEGLGSSATLLFPKSSLMAKELEPWGFEDREHLWQLIQEFSQDKFIGCQKGLASSIANAEWAKYRHLGIIN